MTEKIKEVERSIDIYLDNGFKVVASYKIDYEKS